MGHRRTLTRLLAVLAMLLAVALTASCIPPQEPNPPDDPPVDEEPGDDDDDPPLPVEQMVIELQTPIPGYTAPMTVDTTTGHVVQLTELTGGDIAPQCFGTVGDNSMCLGAFQPQQPIVIQGEATTDRLLKAGGESIPALQWLVDEAVQAVAVLHDLPVDARIERYARPQIRTYMVTRLLDILDKAAYGEQLTADEQRALEFLQRQVLEEDRILTRYAYEEHERFVRESCAYVPPPAPAFVTEPVPVPAAWQSWCAMHGVGYGALWPPPMPPVEVFQTWGMYRAASQLGLDVLNSPEMQAHLGAVARAGTMAAGVVAAVGTGALAYSLVGANAALATAIQGAIFPHASWVGLTSVTLPVTMGAVGAAIIVTTVVLALVSIGIGVWQLIERDQVGATLTARMNAAASATDPFGLAELASQNAGRDLDADRDSWDESNLPRYRSAESVSRLTELVTRWTAVRPNGEVVPDPTDLWTPNATTSEDLRFRVRDADGTEHLEDEIELPAPGGGTVRVRFDDSWMIVTANGKSQPALDVKFLDAEGEVRVATRRTGTDGRPVLVVVGEEDGELDAELDERIEFLDAQGGVVSASIVAPPKVVPGGPRPGVVGRFLPGHRHELSPNPVDTQGRFGEQSFIHDYTYDWTIERLDDATGNWVPVGGVTPRAFAGNDTYGATFLPPSVGRYRATTVMHHRDGAVPDLSGFVEFTVEPPPVQLRDVTLLDDTFADELRLSFQVIEDVPSDQLSVEVQWPGELGSTEPGPVSTLDSVPCNDGIPCATSTVVLTLPAGSRLDVGGEVVVTVRSAHGSAVTQGVRVSNPRRPTFGPPADGANDEAAGEVTFGQPVTYLQVPVWDGDSYPVHTVATIIPGQEVLPNPDPTFRLMDPDNPNSSMTVLEPFGDSSVQVTVNSEFREVRVRSVAGVEHIGTVEVPVVVKQVNGADATLLLRIDIVPAPGDKFRVGVTRGSDFVVEGPPQIDYLIVGGRTDWGDYDGQMCVSLHSSDGANQLCDHVSAFIDEDGTSKPFPFHQLSPTGLTSSAGSYTVRAWLPDSDRAWGAPTAVTFMMLAGTRPPSIDDLRWEEGHAVLEVSPQPSTPIASVSCRVDGGALQPCFGTSGGTWSPPGLSSGAHELWVLVTDTKGNYTTSTLQFTA